MIVSLAASLLATAITISAQTYTLSGCHTHGNVEYCYLPNGTETPWTTLGESSVSTAMPLTATMTMSTATAVVAATGSSPTEATGCHAHEEVQYCMVGSEEWEVTTPVDIATAPDSYTDCHSNGETELHCGNVTLAAASDSAISTTSDTDSETEVDLSTNSNSGISCHDHAGVPHCVDAEGNTVQGSCARPERDYDVPLRIGLLFVILPTSGLGVISPILTARFTKFSMEHIVFVAMRCFSTGVIISTAIVHLFTHAELYFANECLGALEYEATAGAILMAGFFIVFLIEHVAQRINARSPAEPAQKGAAETDEKQPVCVSDEAQLGTNPSAETSGLKTSIMEVGIIFHSVLIGIVLVVAGDSGFITLFIVILFHQVFEGIALGSRLAMIPGSLLRKLLLALAFAITTPLGMAIGIGVLSQFNGNDPATIITIGTLNAFSAGILLWVGVVDMWIADFMHGSLARAGVAKTAVGLVSLVAGLVVMSVLGKWA